MSLIEERWNDKKNFFVNNFDLFGEENNELMNHINEPDLPVKDKLYNFIPYLKKNDLKRGKVDSFIEAIKILIKNGSREECLYGVKQLSEDYINRI